jgi:hypothetical protein
MTIAATRTIACCLRISSRSSVFCLASTIAKDHLISLRRGFVATKGIHIKIIYEKNMAAEPAATDAADAVRSALSTNRATPNAFNS